MERHDLTVGLPKDLESKDFAFVFFRVAARQRREPYAGKRPYSYSPTKNSSASLKSKLCRLPSIPTIFSEEEGRG